MEISHLLPPVLIPETSNTTSRLLSPRRSSSDTTSSVSRRRQRRHNAELPAGDQTEATCGEDRPPLQDMKVAEMMTYDIIAKILSFLPVRSLVRFRCVSKLWYSLTYDPYFQEEQLKISSTRRKYIIYRYYFVNKKMKEMLMYSVDTTKKIKDCYFKLDFPPEDGEEDVYTLSNSVNGLICARGGGGDSDKKGSSCYLMNLSTREVEKLPEHCSRNILYHKLFLGLGFDASSGEYKVIMLEIRFSFHYKILTLGSNQDWRYVGEIPCEPVIIPTSLVFVNGKLHWLSGSNKRSGFVAIFTIDMKDETHGTIAPPVPFRLSWIHNGMSEVAIQEDEEGCLVFLHISLNEMRIWTMKDYITHQWTNTYNIDSDLFLQPELMLLEPDMLFGLAYNKVVFCAEEESKSEGMAAESRSEERMAVCSFDLQTETFQKHCRVIYNNMESYFYSESLLSPRNILLCKDSNNNK